MYIYNNNNIYIYLLYILVTYARHCWPKLLPPNENVVPRQNLGIVVTVITLGHGFYV